MPEQHARPPTLGDSPRRSPWLHAETSIPAPETLVRHTVTEYRIRRFRLPTGGFEQVIDDGFERPSTSVKDRPFVDHKNLTFIEEISDGRTQLLRLTKRP